MTTTEWPSMSQFDSEDSEHVFQQFTGLLDKNGKEIYEGDVLQLFRTKKNAHMKLVNWEVYWDEGKARYFTRSNITALQSLTNLVTNEKHCVIGNVFEHPDLLKA